MPKPKPVREWHHCHWVTMAQVMEYLAVSRDKVDAMCARGDLTKYRNGGIIRFKRIQVDQLLSDGTPRLAGRKAV